MKRREGRRARDSKGRKSRRTSFHAPERTSFPQFARNQSDILLIASRSSRVNSIFGKGTSRIIKRNWWTAWRKNRRVNSARTLAPSRLLIKAGSVLAPSVNARVARYPVCYPAGVVPPSPYCGGTFHYARLHRVS